MSRSAGAHVLREHGLRHLGWMDSALLLCHVPLREAALWPSVHLQGAARRARSVSASNGLLDLHGRPLKRLWAEILRCCTATVAVALRRLRRLQLVRR